MQAGNVCADITQEISDAGKKLPHMGNVPHEDNEASRDIEKSLAHASDVLLDVDSVVRELGENPFELLFFLPDMPEERNDVVLPPPDMQEEKKHVVLSLPDMHPPSILHMFSAFVPRQRAFVLDPACAVYKDDSVQRTEVAGREGDLARHPETCDACMLRRVRLAG